MPRVEKTMMEGKHVPCLNPSHTNSVKFGIENKKVECAPPPRIISVFYKAVSDYDYFKIKSENRKAFFFPY